MLKANELRIGNWVYIPQLKGNRQIGIIEENGRFTTKNHESSFSSIECLNPIELTEDWLVDFGLKPFELDNGEYYYQNNLFRLNSNYAGFYYSKNLRVKYVHQLQNLYFALTGVELELSSNVA